MKTFKNLNEVFKAADSQVTAQELLNGRLYLKGKGWTKVKLSPELKKEVIDKIIETAGGFEKTKNKMLRSFEYSTPQHWAIARFLLSSYEHVRNGDAFFSYCAGQDQQWEMKELRKFLAK